MIRNGRFYVAPQGMPNVQAQNNAPGRVVPRVPRAQALPPTEIECLRAEVEQLRTEAQELEDQRDEARALARVLAHAYKRDARPPGDVVEQALAYPAVP